MTGGVVRPDLVVDRWLTARRDEDLAACWLRDPVLFGYEVCGFVPDPFQAETLWAMAEQDRPIALPAAKGAGKSAVLAIGIWWALTLFPQMKGAATSVSGDNLRDNLWAELALWYSRSPLLQRLFETSSTYIRSREAPETWFFSARTWPKSADENELGKTLAGIHADHTLFVVDEAGGVPEAIGRAAEGALANADPAAGRTARYWLAGNTTRRDSLLGAAKLKYADHYWIRHLTGDPDDPKRAPRISLDWARNQIEQYGRDDPFVCINVLAQFPASALHTLIGEGEIDAARRRRYREEQYSWAPVALGVDPAQEGDDRFVTQARQGLMAFPPKIRRNLRTETAISAVAADAKDCGASVIFIDVTGGMGAPIADGLEHLGFRAVRVNFGGQSADPLYLNKRAEMYTAAKAWLDEGGALPDLDVYLDLAAVQKGVTPSGKMVLEPKDAVKRRLGRSPDVADALVLTFAAPMMAPLAGAMGIPGQPNVGRIRTEYDALAS